MEVERSNVPGYDATLVNLAEHERFVLRNPDNAADVIVVRTVVAFDRGSATDPRPYFRAWGVTVDGSTTRELDANFVDPGALPPHVRDAFAADEAIPEGPREWFGGQPIDHAPQEADPARAERLTRLRERSAWDRADVAALEGRTPQSRGGLFHTQAAQLTQERMGRPHKQPLDPDTVARLRAEHHVQVDTSRNWAATLESAHRESPEATVTDLATVRQAREQGKAFAVIGQYQPDGSVQRPDGSVIPREQVEPTMQALEAAVAHHPSSQPAPRAGRTP